MLKEIVKTTNTQKKDITSFLQSLVRVPTITEIAMEGPYEELVAILEKKFQQLGCKTWIVESEPHKPNVVAKLEGSTGQYTLLFNGHLDVLPATKKGWCVDPFDAEILNNRIYGRGTIDLKGGFTAGIMALQILQTLDVELRGNLIFSGVVDEESGGIPGIKFLVHEHPELIQAESAIIPLPTKMDTVVIANKGALWVDFKTKGTATHSAYPHLGINAITQMTKIVHSLQTLAKTMTRKNPLIATYNEGAAHSTINIAKVQGGGKTNVVPDRCTLNVEVRMIPGETTQRYLDEFHNILRQERERDHNFSGEVKTKFQIEPTEISQNEPIVQTTQQKAKEVLGTPPQIVGAPWFSDSHYLVQDLGVPTLHYGPGRCGTDRAGGYDEYIEIQELLELTSINALIFADLLS